jgi:hypothetical protein
MRTIPFSYFKRSEDKHMFARTSYLLLFFILVSCVPEKRTAITLVAEMKAQNGIAMYNVGQPVVFHIDATILYCTDQDATFSIRQIVDDVYTREIRLAHSCVGTEGTGFDQFCRNGEIETEFIGHCSDTIICSHWAIDETILWDQLEYVQFEEECAGQTILQEIRQQAPEGRYVVTIPVVENNEIRYESVEFIISSTNVEP